MRRNLLKYVIAPEETILNALKKINKNAKGFLIVTDDLQKVLGTITDGDIRRAFINGHNITDKINIAYNKTFKYLNVGNSMSEVIELFKNEKVKFLPIIDNQGKLCNIITKLQMHALLLQDIKANLSYDFFRLNENLVNYEIYQRPWGFYKTSIMNDYFQAKIIFVNPSQQLSLQSHTKREEHWVVAYGNGTVQIGESFIDVKAGNSIFIPKCCKHRLINTDSKKSLIVTELQLGNYFGEDDIIRYEDIYGRVGKDKK